MPSSPNYIRDYSQEYRTSQSSSKEKKRRASRNKARASLIKKGRVKLGDGLDVDHRNKKPLDNSPSNLSVVSKKTNRSFPRNSTGGHR